MRKDDDLIRHAGIRNNRPEKVQLHQQSANEFSAGLYCAIVQAWSDKLRRVGEARLTRWIDAAGW